MRYWWVNQNQTYRHEIRGGYLWSPKRKSNGQRNPYYDFMREAAPGDIVFSYAGAAIRAIGLVRSHAYEAPKPLEFGRAGAYWDYIGWRVAVRFHELHHRVRPAAHMNVLRPLLPARYAPLRLNGAGLQNLYLTHLPETLAAGLIDLIGREARDLVNMLRTEDIDRDTPAIGLVEWEEHVLTRIGTDSSLGETERQAIVLARRGQGIFKRNVMRLERRCRVTGVDREEHLRASHCKPWRDADNRGGGSTARMDCC